MIVQHLHIHDHRSLLASGPKPLARRESAQNRPKLRDIAIEVLNRMSDNKELSLRADFLGYSDDEALFRRIQKLRRAGLIQMTSVEVKRHNSWLITWVDYSHQRGISSRIEKKEPNALVGSLPIWGRLVYPLQNFTQSGVRPSPAIGSAREALVEQRYNVGVHRQPNTRRPAEIRHVGPERAAQSHIKHRAWLVAAIGLTSVHDLKVPDNKRPSRQGG